MNELFKRQQPIVERRGIHLDLKGMPPTPQRLIELLHFFAAARFNVVLVEWEDMFPWRCDTQLQGPGAYTPEEVEDFCRKAAALGLELIPLVQTLGHMETVLRLPQYATLRELPHDPYTLNPLAPGADILLQGMINDVIKLMPNIRHFHLGADEAWSLGLNPNTQTYIAQHGKAALLQRHLKPLFNKLSMHGIRPLMWHDMFIEMSNHDLNVLRQQTDLMVWGYGVHPDDTTLHYNTKYIRRFHEAGICLWGATASKGATAFSSDLPNIQARGENALHWIDIHRRFKLSGIISTAWSRYSADNLQCEPIDAALDSVLYSAIILYNGTTPEGGVEACRAAVANMPGGTPFAACRAMMKRMKLLRRAGWASMQMLHEHLALAKNDPRRRATLPCSSLRELRRVVQDAKVLECDIRKAFAGLVNTHWIAAYCTERLTPFHEACKMFEPQVQAIVPPEVWNFEETNHHWPFLMRNA
jgi:hexosaminidase